MVIHLQMIVREALVVVKVQLAGLT